MSSKSFGVFAFIVAAILYITNGHDILTSFIRGDLGKREADLDAAFKNRDVVGYVSAFTNIQDVELQGSKKDIVVVTKKTTSTFSSGSFKSGFNMDVAKYTPKIFATFPEIKSIRFVWFGPFRNIRGKESIDRAIEATFTRSNSDTIAWNNIAWENVPKLADKYWQHPSLNN